MAWCRACTTDRRVASLLLEHYNRRTGQCDPGLERIAKLLGVSTRTVIRSNHKLERAGLFKKVRHGGHLNRNSYEPNFQRFAELEAAWKQQLKQSSRPSSVTKVSPEQRQSCHIPGDTAVTQTLLSNRPKETYSKGLPGKEEGGTGFRSALNRGPDRSVEAARNEAERRWTLALHERFACHPITYAQIAISENSEFEIKTVFKGPPIGSSYGKMMQFIVAGEVIR